MINPAVFIIIGVAVIVIWFSLMDEFKSIGENIERVIKKIMEEKK